VGNLKNRSIEAMIYVVRGQKVMLDSDLALLYGVETGNLNKAVRRNLERFPQDFMFQLTPNEFLRFQIGRANAKRRFLPYAFTQNGVSMLSSVLRSQVAIQINIQIMRAFTKLKELLLADESLSDRVEELEKGTTQLFDVTFKRLNILERQLPILHPKRKRIGFK
jgi:hypothetical protein